MPTREQTNHPDVTGNGEQTHSSFGSRIRARRKELGLSLEDLAQRTGLTASFLSLVERGMSNPSLESLRHIAEALGVPPFYFSHEPDPTPPMLQNPVVRAGERIQITFPPGDVTSELLVPNLRNRLEVFITHVKPSAGNIARPPPLETEECLLVLKGKVRVVLNDQEYVLSEGDSIYIHGYALREISAVEEETVFLSAITPPIF
ncbi:MULTISPECIES: helix-turn-helix domain-containing protein [Caldilinea]|jgi:transcriptional regulator with XRE-family HTH domain|uniref:Putative DNA-binding protein n=1 Tax=Caldilinea aerophila (strain DSM 14535 / JCM 11387 / NBRC 104270 / STL-6-O1) TaxID=926550 RepID=I0HYL9_CALAS|nr:MULTISPECIES: XRE family transcriptional regulator [Caldilinea]MBO9391575.1 helix-turn-helix transcriptional regulator [Caldilinea sp.]BAL98106.1 putative DNA-binding protein [Caldilinea aerophila DSM 14535 = NBRC 104270]GIV75423.1 MAG: MerR family transcriptional regulator [Caldilinea sp.]